MNLEQARFFMVEQQIRPWDVLDPQVLDLFNHIPRHTFVAESQQALAYCDIELPIGEQQHMLAPKIEGRILQAVDVGNEDRVLEIGTGSGYLTALLATQAKQVVTVEFFESLQQQAKPRLAAFNNIEFFVGDASQNWNDQQEYDVIILGGSSAILPENYKQKLSLGGRLFAIIGESPAMEAILMTRIGEHEWLTESLFETDTTPLINAQASAKFAL